MLAIKEIFSTLQGEGPNSGRAATFIRTVGCNQWSGREEDRESSACPFCDTNFNHDQYTLAFEDGKDLVHYLTQYFYNYEEHGIVVTGGEPLLQFNEDDICHLAEKVPWLDIETNGTRPLNKKNLLDNVNVICSPKTDDINIDPDYWKILIPDKEPWIDFALHHGAPVYLQPTDGPSYKANLIRTIELCRQHQNTVLSLQVHKIAGLR